MSSLVIQQEHATPRHANRQVLAMAAFMLLSFSTLKYLPGMLIVQDLWTAIVLVGVLFVYLPYVMKHGFLNVWFEGYVLLMMIVAPLISAFGALSEFGQPLFYGLAANRSTSLMGAGLLYTVLFRAGIVNLELTRRAVTLIACVSVLGWSIASVAVDVMAFDEPIPGLVEIGEGGKLLLDPSFIVFGYFYYLFSYYFSGNKRHGWIALAILTYLVLGMGGRLCIAATLLTSVLFLGRGSSLDQKLIGAVKFALGAVLMAAAMYAVNAEKVEALIEKFGYAVEAVVSGEEVEDVSARARLIEKWIAEPYIENNFWFGNGFLSNQWEDGFKGKFGYFHPSDIGFFGVIFQYGMLGSLLFIFQYIFLIKAWATMPKHGVFIKSIFAVSLYWFLYSFGTGWFAFSSEQISFVIAMLSCFQLNSSRDFS
jgi:hypothetical protein